MSEKRYFKVFSKKHILGSQNKYIVLFDLISKLEKDDDSIIIKKMAAKGYDCNYLSADKNYLNKLILRCLNEYYFEHNINLTVKNNLQTVEILFQKALYKECLKVISQTEKLISQIENYALMLEALVWKRKCYGYAYGLTKAKTVNAEMDACVYKVNNLNAIVEIYYNTYSVRLNEGMHTAAEHEHILKNMISDPLLSSEDNALSIQAKIFFNLCFVHHYYLMDDFDNEYKHHKRIVEILQENPHYQRENAMDAVALYNRLLAQSKYLDSETFNKDILALKDFDISHSFSPPVIKQRIFIHVSINELEHLFIHHQYLQAEQQIEQILSEINKYQYLIEPYYTIQLNYLFTLISISVGKFTQALDYSHKIINEYSISDNTPIYLRTKVLNIMAHFESENYKLVENLCKSFLKKYKANRTLEDFEIKLINFLYKSCLYGNKPRTSVLHSNFAQLFEEAVNYSSLPYQRKQIIEYYVRWLNSKLQKSTITGIYQQ